MASAVDAHGTFMGLAWLVLAPVAILSALFRSKFKNPATWFYVHVGANVGVVVCTVLGIICIWVRDEDEDEDGDRRRLEDDEATEEAHGAIGSLVFWLLLLHGIVGVLRPGKDSARPKLRKAWVVGHHIVGYILLLFALVNCWTGIAMTAGDAAVIPVPIIALAMVVAVVIAKAPALPLRREEQSKPLAASIERYSESRAAVTQHEDDKEDKEDAMELASF